MTLDDIRLVDVGNQPQQNDQHDQPQVTVDIHATLTCPVCGTKQKVIMPTQGQQHYYKCTNPDCAADLSPIEEADCVFCSYSDKICPPRQTNPDLGKKELHSLI